MANKLVYVTCIVLFIVAMFIMNLQSAPAPNTAGSATVRGGDHSLPKVVTLEQLRSWNRNGFLIMPKAMSQEQIATLRRYLDEMNAMPAKRGGIWKYFEADRANSSLRLLNRIEKFTSYHEGMRRFIDLPIVRGVAEDLLGESVYLFKEKVNYKLPGGGGFEPHQDMQPGWDKFAPQMVSVLLCADENTPENGMLEIAPGAHARPGGLIGRMNEPLNATETSGLKWIPVMAQPGDIVFFDAWAPHRSAPNLSRKARRNTYITYNGRKAGNHREAYYSEKFRNLPPDADREQGKDYRYKV